METKRRLLFVDDEQCVQADFQHLFGSMNNAWEMEFVRSAKDALEVLERKPFDVLITDMRMPGTDGAELLKETNRRFPQLMRLVLSSFADQESILEL